MANNSNKYIFFYFYCINHLKTSFVDNLGMEKTLLFGRRKRNYKMNNKSVSFKNDNKT